MGIRRIQLFTIRYGIPAGCNLWGQCCSYTPRHKIPSIFFLYLDFSQQIVFRFWFRFWFRFHSIECVAYGFFSSLINNVDRFGWISSNWRWFFSLFNCKMHIIFSSWSFSSYVGETISHNHRIHIHMSIQSQSPSQ